MEVIIGVLVAVAFTLFVVLSSYEKEFKIALDTLELVMGLFLSGEIDEETMRKHRSRIVNNFNWYQRILFARKKNTILFRRAEIVILLVGDICLCIYISTYIN